MILNSRASNWKITSIREEFNSNSYISTALNVLVTWLSFKTQRKIEFLRPFYSLKISLKKPGNVVFMGFQLSSG